MINLFGLIAVVAQKCAMKVGLAMIRTDAKTKNKTKTKDRDQDNYGRMCSGCPKVCDEECESTACHFVSRYFE